MKIVFLLTLIAGLHSCIFTTQKPPEAIEVKVPASSQTNITNDSTQTILITITKNGKCLLTLGEKTKRMEIIQNLNTMRSLSLSQEEMIKLSQLHTIGMPLNRIKKTLESNQSVAIDKLEGIPIKDTVNNEMIYWMQSVSNSYKDSSLTTLGNIILIKGNIENSYALFKNIKHALKTNRIYKFRLVTNE
jgi:Biopolymer transport protein ExbD/TolR